MVTFSFETKIELYSNKCEFVRSSTGKQTEPRCTMKTVMFWGLYERDGKKRLIKVNNSVNGTKFIRFLKEHLIPGLDEDRHFLVLRNSISQIAFNRE